MNLLTTTAYNVFTANTKAKSAEVNTNFTLVKSHLSDFTKDAKHGTIALQTSAKSADYAVLDDDGIHTVLMTTGASNRTVTLPTAADNSGRILKVKKVDSGAGTCIVDGENTETIDGATTITLFYQYDAVEIQCDGTAWHVIDRKFAGPVASPGDADLSVSASDNYQTIIYSTTLTANRTITLPAASSCPGRRIAIKRGAGGAFRLIIAVTSSGTIDGSTSSTLNALYSSKGSATVVSNGTDWFWEHQPYDAGTWTGVITALTNLTLSTAVYTTQEYTRVGRLVIATVASVTGATFTLGTAGNTTHLTWDTAGLPNYANSTSPYGHCSLISSAPRNAPGALIEPTGGNANIQVVFTTLNMANGDSVYLSSFFMSYLLT
jgi:hypothetical protein